MLSKVTLTRLLPNGRPVAWGTLLDSAGDQISEREARTGI